VFDSSKICEICSFLVDGLYSAPLSNAASGSCSVWLLLVQSKSTRVFGVSQNIRVQVKGRRLASFQSQTSD
jgi:hypothetical protein